MITTASPAETTRGRATALWSDSLVFAGRNIEHIRQIPEKLLDVTAQPLMFVVLFAYVFGGAIIVPGATTANTSSAASSCSPSRSA